MQYTHGGDIWSCPAPVLDFSANLNPLGMPPQVRQAAEASITDAVHYPDPACRKLTAGIAARDGVKPEQVLCGAGAADLIFRLVWAERPRRAMVTAPTFSEYGQALRAAGAEVISHRLRREDGFDLTEDILRHIDHDLDMLFLCTPNNPTGRTIPTQLLETIARRYGEMGVRLVVDECFLELTDGAQGMAGRLEEFPTLFLLRAFTKSYAIPGLRLGYCLTADRPLLEKMEACAPAWAVSVPAQAAGLAALEQPGWPQQARAVIGPARERLLSELGELGLEVWPGQANYLLFRAPGQCDLKERMAERGILLRSCANYDGLGPDYYRAAVRLPEENERLISTLRAVLVEN